MGTYLSYQQKSDREGCVLLATATGAKTNQSPILSCGPLSMGGGNLVDRQ